jgi:hypothetical protein
VKNVAFFDLLAHRRFMKATWIYSLRACLLSCFSMITFLNDSIFIYRVAMDGHPMHAYAGYCFAAPAVTALFRLSTPARTVICSSFSSKVASYVLIHLLCKRSTDSISPEDTIASPLHSFIAF